MACRRDLLLAALLAAAVGPARADVALKNGNYFTSAQDIVDKTDPELTITRYYNSKSSFVGMLGLGWCQAWEAYIGTDGTLHEWGGGATVRDVTLVRQGGLRARNQTDGGRQFFDEGGRLVELDGKSQARLDYDAEGRLAAVTDGAGRAVRFKWGALGRVIEISSPAGASSYDYDSQGLLTHVRQADGTELRYQYDPQGRGNLIEIDFADGSSETVDYFGPDLFENVREIKDRTGAVTRYDYRRDPADPAVNRVEVVEVADTRRPESRRVYEFKNPPFASKPALPRGVAPMTHAPSPQAAAHPAPPPVLAAERMGEPETAPWRILATAGILLAAALGIALARRRR